MNCAISTSSWCGDGHLQTVPVRWASIVGGHHTAGICQPMVQCQSGSSGPVVSSSMVYNIHPSQGGSTLDCVAQYTTVEQVVRQPPGKGIDGWGIHSRSEGCGWAGSWRKRIGVSYTYDYHTVCHVTVLRKASHVIGHVTHFWLR